MKEEIDYNHLTKREAQDATRPSLGDLDREESRRIYRAGYYRAGYVLAMRVLQSDLVLDDETRAARDYFIEIGGCPTCGGCFMVPDPDPDGDIMNTPCPDCNFQGQETEPELETKQDNG